MSVLTPSVHPHFLPSAETCRFAPDKVDLKPGPLSLDLDDHTELLSSITSALISLSSFSQDILDSGETESFNITPFRPKSAKLRPLPHARRFRVAEGSKAMLKQAILARIREKAKEDFAVRVKRDMANLATTLGIDPELLPEFRRRMDAARQRGYKGYSPIYSRSAPCDSSPDQENGLPSRSKRSVIRMSRSFGFTKGDTAVVEANVAGKREYLLKWFKLAHSPDCLRGSLN